MLLDVCRCALWLYRLSRYWRLSHASEDFDHLLTPQICRRSGRIGTPREGARDSEKRGAQGLELANFALGRSEQLSDLQNPPQIHSADFAAQRLGSGEFSCFMVGRCRVKSHHTNYFFFLGGGGRGGVVVVCVFSCLSFSFSFLWGSCLDCRELLATIPAISESFGVICCGFHTSLSFGVICCGFHGCFHCNYTWEIH